MSRPITISNVFIEVYETGMDIFKISHEVNYRHLYRYTFFYRTHYRVNSCNMFSIDISFE